MKTLGIALFCLAMSPLVASTQSPGGPIFVTLWFDTEDYVLPSSDDAAKRLAEELTALGVRATFKVVGEKARVLERRGRKDVIDALRKHEIGYHTEWHSRHPTPAEYLRDAPFLAGVEDFALREAQGLKDVGRIFGTVPACYGQPGSSWAPHSHRALRRLGVPMYLDEADHVGIDDQPFYYGGILNVFRMRSAVTRMELRGGDSLERGKTRFRETADRLRRRGGGLISIYYHPCEFVHRQFWDGVNFARGSNPPPEQWKLPPVRPAAEIEQSYADFSRYIDFIRSEPGVRFVTCADMLRLYDDPARSHSFTREELLALARSARNEIGFSRVGAMTLSASDVFGLLTTAADRMLSDANSSRTVPLTTVDGPEHPFTGPAAPAQFTAQWHEFSDAVHRTALSCQALAMMPSEIWLGSRSIAPADYLATLAEVFPGLAAGKAHPPTVAIVAGKTSFERYVAADAPGLWGWVIFPEGFHAPRIMELARLQAWTLKPAVLRPSALGE